jgi:hypothetical protein
MKRIVPAPVIVAGLVASVLTAGCSSMGQGSRETTAMPEVETQKVCEIQRQWTRMAPDEQSAALNYHLRTLSATYNKEDIDALRQRVRTTKC